MAAIYLLRSEELLRDLVAPVAECAFSELHDVDRERSERRDRQQTRDVRFRAIDGERDEDQVLRVRSERDRSHVIRRSGQRDGD